MDKLYVVCYRKNCSAWYDERQSFDGGSIGVFDTVELANDAIKNLKLEKLYGWNKGIEVDDDRSFLDDDGTLNRTIEMFNVDGSNAPYFWFSCELEFYVEELKHNVIDHDKCDLY